MTDYPKSILVDGIAFHIHPTGYYYGKGLKLHRYLWEKKNGPIKRGYVVHHINGNRLDNSLSNLALMTHGQHSTLHNVERWASGSKIGRDPAPLCIEKGCSRKNKARGLCYFHNRRLLGNGDKTIPMKDRTHCPQGHLYSKENTLISIRSDGGKGRVCRECGRLRCKEYYLRRKDK